MDLIGGIFGKTDPMQAKGEKMMTQATQGKLLPGQKLEANQFQAQELARYHQLMANMGIPVGTGMADYETKAAQDTAAFKNKELQQNFDQGSKMVGLSMEEMRAKTEQDKEFADIMMWITKMVPYMMGDSPGGAPGSPTELTWLDGGNFVVGGEVIG